MNDLLLTARLDISETLRARWFLVYTLVFGGIIVGLLTFGLTESRVMGVTGLSRTLVTFIQLSMAILPIFILLSTVRSLAGDREAGVYEYLLSLPVSLAGWYWGKFLGRFVVVFLPLFLALGFAAVWGLITGQDIPWGHLGYYIVMMISLAICFLGIGFLISSFVRSTDVGQGAAFLIWLLLLLFLDLVLLGLIIRTNTPPELVVAIALLNPLQTFRTAAMILFDPQLILLGPSAYVILDFFGRSNYMIFSICYPLIIGGISGALGFLWFRDSDLQ